MQGIQAHASHNSHSPTRLRDCHETTRGFLAKVTSAAHMPEWDAVAATA